MSTFWSFYNKKKTKAGGMAVLDHTEDVTRRTNQGCEGVREEVGYELRVEFLTPLL